MLSLQSQLSTLENSFLQRLFLIGIRRDQNYCLLELGLLTDVTTGALLVIQKGRRTVGITSLSRCHVVKQVSLAAGNLRNITKEAL